jgi:hypothetical protein
MKVICINNSDILNEYEAKNGKGFRKKTIELLTKDKTYEVVKTGNLINVCSEMYYIKDNSDEERWYYYSRFKDISTIREEKLKQLGI